MNKFEQTPQWNSGSDVANFLDAFFRARGWQIEPTTPYEERKQCLGDRHFRQKDTHYHVEYKSGIQTFYTGNIFLETVSVDSAGKEGWVYTCKADYILYGALLNHKILVFLPEQLRFVIDDLKLKFREVRTGKNQNNGYNTHGVIVPLDYALQHFAHQVISTEETP